MKTIENLEQWETAIARCPADAITVQHLDSGEIGTIVAQSSTEVVLISPPDREPSVAVFVVPLDHAWYRDWEGLPI